MGPPETVDKIGFMSHTCQDDLVLKVTQTDVPYFNAPIYLENKQQVSNVFGKYLLERPSIWKIINLPVLPLSTKSRPYFRTFLLCINVL